MNRFRDVDRGASYVVRRAAELAKRVEFSVGVPADAGTYPNGTPVATVAAAHEFGLGTVPQRSFIRGWYDGRTPADYAKQFALLGQEAIMAGVPIRDAFELLGKQYVAEVRARMDKGIPPALQPETVARKARRGSSTPETPLEDTHLLRSSIEAKVRIV